MVKKKIKKEEIAPHIVVTDTNILWFKDKKEVVDPEFNEFWDKYQNDFNLRLIIPDVVRGELIFQQSTSAINSLTKLLECMDNISGITNKKYNNQITDNQIKKNVAARFDKWLKKKNGKVIDTPINSIDWKNLINKAVWREAPFEFNKQKDLNEKGFRDALILETVKDYCITETNEYVITFICSDELLRTTTEKELKKNERFVAFESLEQFSSYLKLTQEDLTNKFVKFLLRKAQNKFFNPKSQSGIYYKFDLNSKINLKFKDYFLDPTLSS